MDWLNSITILIRLSDRQIIEVNLSHRLLYLKIRSHYESMKALRTINLMKLKRVVCILAILLVVDAYGQQKDRRAELGIRGRVSDISVSPDERIWLTTAMGKTYYTNHIDSNWHYGTPLYESEDDSGLDHPNLDRISFFNKDTAIMTGYISHSQKEYKKNGYFRTTDGGRSWELLDYGGNSWIYTVTVDSEGNAWMGGLSKKMYYSSDYGKSWTTIKLPYKSCDRTYSLFMKNPEIGIAGSDENEIITTDDNWKSVKHIETPLDQNKYKPDETRGYVDNRISRVAIWKKYLVVSQNGQIFYSDKDNIDWKPFASNLFDFDFDKTTNQLFAVTSDLKILSFFTPSNYSQFTNYSLVNYPIDIKAVNGSLFVVIRGYDVYKVNQGGLTRSIPYTHDKKISKPRLVKQGLNLKWGINKDQIYLQDDDSGWYRENALNFSVSDFKLVDDSLAILWNGTKNYTYSLRTHEATKYYPESPLQTFLKSPVSLFVISSGSRGCFHSSSDDIAYKRTSDSNFAASAVVGSDFYDKETSSYKNSIEDAQLNDALKIVNSNPSRRPVLKDFKITAEDIEKYLSKVDKRLKQKDYSYGSKKKVDKDFYYAIPSKLDSLDDHIISAIFEQREGVWSTTSNWFKILIVNQNNDTLNIARNYYVSTLPWNLPWHFEYNGQHINSYNIEFSRFVDSCIPDDFMGAGIFDNSVLLMEIADYLWNDDN